MVDFILKNLVNILLPMLTPEVVKQGLDAFFDVVEDALNKSETKYDNYVVLPVIKILRNALDVPDNDNTN